MTTLKKGALVEIGPGCGFSGTVIASAKRVEIGCNVRCGANTLIMDTDWHTDDPRTSPDAQVTIEDNVWLGVGVMVMKGVTIGKNTVVGAGSIVGRSLPSGVVAVGVPARVVKRIDASSLDTLQFRG
jgi:acetyltransferase-like isoleucine patch superfamily enzyme